MGIIVNQTLKLARMLAAEQRRQAESPEVQQAALEQAIESGDTELAETITKRMRDTPEHATKMMFRALAQADAIPAEAAQEIPSMFPIWSDCIGHKAEVGAYYQHDDQLWRVTLEHTIQADWAPGQAAALFTLAADPGEEWPEFIQPTGGHNAYSKGDKVTFEGQRYTSLIDGNTWSPAAYPAGWQKA